MSNGARPNNFMIPAVLSTICCCIPLGIVAIIQASKVNPLADAGNLAAAEEAAGKAKMWTFIAVGVGLVINLIVGVLQVLAFMAQQSSY